METKILSTKKESNELVIETTNNILKNKGIVVCINPEMRKGRLYRCTDLGKEILKKL